MIGTIGAIAAGGALGAVMRHGVNQLTLAWFGPGFPWGTLGVNIIGSFAIGLLIALFAHLGDPPHAVKLFLVTGLLGAFTTFSAFSLDVALLWERGASLEALAYVIASVVLSIGALFLAMFIVRSVIA